MNGSEIARYKTLIHDRIAALEAENLLGQGAQAVVQLDQQSVGRLSRMDALQSQAMAKAQQVRRDLQTRRLHAALARVEIESFGYCDECGESIAPKRLDLDPAVITCIGCATG